MRGSQGGKHAIRGYLAQILISVMKTLREDNTWDEFEIESEEEDKVDTKYTSLDLSEILAVQVKQSINRINESKIKKWAEELRNDIKATSYELHIVSYTTEDVIKMKSHKGVSLKLHQVNYKELKESATDRLNNYVGYLGYNRTNPRFIEIILKSLITDFFFWAINGGKISRKDFDDNIKSYMSFDNPDLIVKEDKKTDDNVKLRNRVQSIFKNIREDLNKLKIEEHTLVSQGNTDYHYILKQSWDHEASDKANLKLFMNGFYEYIRSIKKDDRKYFGINAAGDISFCFKKYKFLNYLIRCPSHLAIANRELINIILSDMKEISKNRYQIELD
ncbi:hypothetical protein LCGC14_0930600 [marine sediment metagenome]|uniref:Uncharacterized protein n=1 Tax=marine sediment metagenome TaxID=412755 RepID=A0A0F9P904_9ZZZZ